MIFTLIFNIETDFSTKIICALFVLYLARPVTEHKFCCKLSRSISIHNRYCNRFIDLGRPIFLLNHSGVYNPNNIRYPACAVLHSRRAGHRMCDPSWIIATGLSYCSVNPLRPQNCIYLQSDLSCLYKLNWYIFSHHHRLYFYLHPPAPDIRFGWLW